MNSKVRLSILCMTACALSCACSGSDETDPSNAPTFACTREGLRELVDYYFDALAAHDAARLPLASEVKFTENAARLEPGDGLWQKAGNVRFKRSAFDTEHCGTHMQAVLDEDGAPIIFGVRLKLVRQRITEIETYVVREGAYFLFNPEALATSDEEGLTDVQWEALVPEEQRNTRDELNEIADLYFESFGPAGIVARSRAIVTAGKTACVRLQAIVPMFLPAPGQGQGGITHRRYPIADIEVGIAIDTCCSEMPSTFTCSRSSMARFA